MDNYDIKLTFSIRGVTYPTPLPIPNPVFAFSEVLVQKLDDWEDNELTLIVDYNIIMMHDRLRKLGWRSIFIIHTQTIKRA
jgi:hypothetical protein